MPSFKHDRACLSKPKWEELAGVTHKEMRGLRKRNDPVPIFMYIPPVNR